MEKLLTEVLCSDEKTLASKQLKKTKPKQIKTEKASKQVYLFSKITKQDRDGVSEPLSFELSIFKRNLLQRLITCFIHSLLPHLFL